MGPSAQSGQKFNVDMFRDRLPDGGPRYIETPTSGDLQGWRIAEPFNSISALLFVVISTYWLIRLYRRTAVRSPLLVISMPILLLGGIGGTLYHATRTSKLFFLLDVVPIFALAVLVAAWLWHRSGRSKLWLGTLVIMATGAHGAAFAVMSAHAAVNTSYVTLALLILIPLGLNLVSDRGFGWSWVVAALTNFAAALFFRIVDSWGPQPYFPMGTHWLWHLFGGMSSAMLIIYIHALTQLERATSSN